MHVIDGVDSLEHGPRVQEIVGSNLGRVKPMTYKILYLLLPSRVFAIISIGQ